MLDQPLNPCQVSSHLLQVLEAVKMGMVFTFFFRLDQDWAVKGKQAIRFAYGISILGEGTTWEDKFFAYLDDSRSSTKLLHEHLEPTLNATHHGGQ